MADATKIGKDWDEAELDAIVSDYFQMLALELRGQVYVKAHRAAALMDRIGRTHRSVEFKHMNISAVLTELGLPTIRGYKPKPNFQNAIFDAIDRFLSGHPEVLQPNPAMGHEFAESPGLFEEPPPALSLRRSPAARLQLLLQKFDPVERDFRNRNLGKAGEETVLEFERRQLMLADRADLARKVRWVSQEDGDGAGYDILSFAPEGREKLIEVKTTCGGPLTPFFLTRNEHETAEQRSLEFQLYRLYDFAAEPKLFRPHPPLDDALVLRTEVWRASFA